MNARVGALMSAQWGLITRRQAIGAGMLGHRIDSLVRAGTWIAVRRGVYAEAAYVSSLTTYPTSGCSRTGPTVCASTTRM